MSRHVHSHRDPCGRPAGRPAQPSRSVRLASAAVLASGLALSACSSLKAPSLPSFTLPSVALPSLPTSLPRPYTLEIQQGIVVDQKMVGKLTPGMTRNQVGLTLGTPLLTDVLHADRWDYVYYTRKAGEVGEWRRFACLFRNDVLVQVTGDVTVAAGSAPAMVPPAGDAGTSTGLPQPLPDAGGPPSGGPKK